jgi:uncharacterized repeat protein (TIGR01451 family)
MKPSDSEKTFVRENPSPWCFRFGLAVLTFILALPVDRALTSDIIVGRSDGDNMRWAAYRFDPSGVTPDYFLLGTEQGHSWGPNRSVTALASGDLDGDGVLEVVVGRDGHGPGGNMRWAAFRVFDDAIVQIGPEQGGGWGDDRGVTDIAIGDVTNDGRDEVVIGRSDGDNMRWSVYSLLPDESGFNLVGTEQGHGWGPSRSATALAIGDLDGAGGLDIVVGRDGHGPGGNMRWQAFTFSQAAADFVALSPAQGEGWGDDRGVEDIATGDIDGDGLDEVIVGRSDGPNMRWQAFRLSGGNFQSVGPEQGNNWGTSRGVRALATGDLDGDGIQEVIVGRDGHGPGGNMRWAAYSFTAGDFSLVGSEQGHSWGDDRFVTALGTGDVDGDGRDDVVVGRDGDNQDGNMRWHVFRLATDNSDFESVGPEQGHNWGDDRGATAAIITDPPLDSDGDGLLDTWEINGIPGTDLNGTGVALTTDPLHKDLIWEIDWMSNADAPTAAQVQALKNAFAAAPVNAGGIENPDGQLGITLWVDTGTLVDPTTGVPVGDDLGGGALAASPLDVSGLTANFYTIKAANFQAARRRTVRYALMAPGPSNDTGISTGGNTATTLNDTGQNWLLNEWEGRTLTINGGTGAGQTATIATNTQNQLVVQTTPAFTGFSPVPDNTSTYRISGTGGQAELGGNDLVEFNHNAATIMHEMGHNLNLDHGGDVSANCKVNYVSVMNYDHQVGFPGGAPGIPRVGGGTIIDFSPPRITGNNRGLSVLPNVNETNLNEPVVLDPSDNRNRAIYTNINQDKVQRRLDRSINWNSAPGEGPFAFNTDLEDATAGTPRGCSGNTLLSLHAGFNDWSNIVLPIAVFGDAEDAAVNPVIGPEPTLEEQQALGTALATTDLAASKSSHPEIATAGWDKVRFELTVRNLGPNPADQAQLSDTIPEAFVVEDLPENCSQNDGIICLLGTIEAGEEQALSLSALTPASRVEDAGFVPVTTTNTIEAQTTLGPDPNELNNIANSRIILVPAAAVWYPFPDRGLTISDQFVEENPFHDPRPQALLAPAAIQDDPVPRLDGTHLSAYALVPTQDTQSVDALVHLENVFGERTLQVSGTATHLLVPTGKSLTSQPVPPDEEAQTVPHYQCYRLTDPKADCDCKNLAPPPKAIPVSYTDQFDRRRNARIRETDLILCNPAEKNGEPIPNPDTPHLTCYPMESRKSSAIGRTVTLQNQFGIMAEELDQPARLCVATRKEHKETETRRTDLTVEPALPPAPSQGLLGAPGFDYCAAPPGGGTSRAIVFDVVNASGEASGATTATVAFEDVAEVSVDVPGLASGASVELGADIPRGCFTGSGSSTCSFSIIVDPDQAIPETNELNNSASAFCVQAAG